MKRLFMLCILALTLLGCAQNGLVNKDVSAGEAAQLIERNSDIIVLDVRTPEEFARGHLPDAMNINYYDEDFREQLEELDKEKQYVVYCAAGKRGGFALEIMKELQFKEAYNIEGGMAACETAGFETTT